MKSEKALVYLCNNKKFLGLWLSKLFKEKVDADLYIIVNERNKQLIPYFIKMIEKSGHPFNNVRIYHDGTLLNDFKGGLKKNIQRMIDTYELSIKVLLPWYIIEELEYLQMIFMDDDTCLFKNPFVLMNDKKVFTTFNFLDNIYKVPSKNNKADILNFIKCFQNKDFGNFEEGLKFIERHRSDAGIWGINRRFYWDIYRGAVLRFFDSGYFQHLILNTKKRTFNKFINKTDKPKNIDADKFKSSNRIRTFDQRLFTIAFFLYDHSQVSWISPNKDIFHLFIHIFPKWLSKRKSAPQGTPYFIHYGASSWKNEFNEYIGKYYNFTENGERIPNVNYEA